AGHGGFVAHQAQAADGLGSQAGVGVLGQLREQRNVIVVQLADDAGVVGLIEVDEAH
nr:hypothetical protein [Tanacetum cinerariifolium]